MSANPASIAIGIQDPSVLVGELTTLVVSVTLV